MMSTDKNTAHFNANISITSIYDLLQVLFTLVIIVFIICVFIITVPTVVISSFRIFVYVNNKVQQLLENNNKPLTSENEQETEGQERHTAPADHTVESTEDQEVSSATLFEPRRTEMRASATFQPPKTEPDQWDSAETEATTTMQQPRVRPNLQDSTKTKTITTFLKPETGPNQVVDSTETKAPITSQQTRVPGTFQQPRTGPTHGEHTEKATFQQPRTGLNQWNSTETEAPTSFQQPRTVPIQRENTEVKTTFQQPRTEVNQCDSGEAEAASTSQLQKPREGPIHGKSTETKAPTTFQHKYRKNTCLETKAPTNFQQKRVPTTFEQPRTGPNRRENIEIQSTFPPIQQPRTGINQGDSTETKALTTWPVSNAANSSQVNEDEEELAFDEGDLSPDGAEVVSYRSQQRQRGELDNVNVLSQVLYQTPAVRQLLELFSDILVAIRATQTTGLVVPRAIGGECICTGAAVAEYGLPFQPDEMMRYFMIVAKEMPADWQELAINLGVPFARIETVSAQYPNAIMMCCLRILFMWHRNNGLEATIETLIKAVKETGNQGVAEMLEKLEGVVPAIEPD